MLADILKLENCREMQGVAPKSDLEHQVQNWIDQHEGKAAKSTGKK